MKKLFKPEMMKNVLWILAILLVLKMVWFVVDILWLSSVDINQKKEQGIKSLYYKVKLTPNKIAAPVPRSTPRPVAKKPTGDIKNIKLLGIYNASDITVLTIEHKGKTKVVSRGEKIDGFEVFGAGNDYAIFHKAGKEYKVWLVKNASAEKNMKMIKPIAAPKIEAPAIVEAVSDGETRIIDRTMLNHYAENMDDIYKNIGITELKKGNDLTGFKINFVKRGSPFAKLGMRRNDVIKSINGKEITSYNAAFGVYKNLKDIDSLSIVIVRENEEMELEYEIN
jgi:general secretion pathway protein C